MTSFGINLPQDAGEAGHDGELLRRFVTAAEDAGISSLWVSESTAPGVLDPLGVLQHAAAVSRSAALGAAVLLPAFRAPVRLAREIATLDRLSGGRTIIGVGLGNGRDQYRLHRLEVPHRGDHFEEAIHVLRSLLSQERTTSSQPWWDYDDVVRPLVPLQRPMPPLWFGARSAAALERAVRLGDGWIGAGSARGADFEAALETLRGVLSDAGRDPDTFTVAKRVYLHVVGPRGRTAADRGRLEGWFRHHYGRPSLADEVAVTGPAEFCAEHLDRLRRLGVDTVVLHPVVDHLAQLELLVTDVLPQLDQQPVVEPRAPQPPRRSSDPEGDPTWQA
jgi:alkanesulfonate monooxygenase SsuD/methylene tetrahydromethanopterin reductase-like flavin-dependent oxidoreductase (luciferase family)